MVPRAAQEEEAAAGEQSRPTADLVAQLLLVGMPGGGHRRAGERWEGHRRWRHRYVVTVALP
jgi:hypothetical protein